MRKKLLSLSAAIVIAVSTLAGCGDTSSNETSSSDTSAEGGSQEDSTEEGASGDKVTLSLCWWGNQKRNDVTKQAVDLYMSQNPNIEIKVEFTDWSGYWDKMSAMAAGGNLPDIIQQDYSYIAQYQKSGQLADLTEFIENGTIQTENIVDSIIESGSIDGKVYGLSLGSNAPAMTYDKAIVEEAGVTIPEQVTIDELYDISQQIYEKTGVKTYFDGGSDMMQIIARTRGSHMFEELAAGNKEFSLEHYENVEKFAKAEFSISSDLLAEKNPDVVETKPIIDGTTWNDFMYSNQLISVVETAGREIEIAMYPTTSDAVSQPMYLKPSMFFSIAETSKNKEEAAKFIDWFTNDEECNKILMAERGVPINSEIADILKEEVDEVSQKVFDYIATVSEIATPIDELDPAGKGEVVALSKTIAEELRYGNLNAEEATDQFVSGAKSILEEAAK